MTYVRESKTMLTPLDALDAALDADPLDADPLDAAELVKMKYLEAMVAITPMVNGILKPKQ